VCEESIPFAVASLQSTTVYLSAAGVVTLNEHDLCGPNSDHTNTANCELNRELRTQVSDTSKSASSLSTIINKQYHFMSSSGQFPVPVRSAVKSNLTNWCCKNLSKHVYSW